MSRRGRIGWSRRRIATGAVASAVIAAALVWLVGFTGVFGVRKVVVTGAAATVPASVVERVAQVPMGEPLARLDGGAIAARVAALPAVAAVTVHRVWPATARIDVTARVAVAVVPAGSGYSLVDATGVRFATVTKAPAGLPTLVQHDPVRLDRADRAALRVVSGLPASLRSAVAVVEAPTSYSVTLGLRDGRTVIWGGADDGVEKARVVAVLLTRPGTTFDVSVPSVSVVR